MIFRPIPILALPWLHTFWESRKLKISLTLKLGLPPPPPPTPSPTCSTYSTFFAPALLTDVLYNATHMILHTLKLAHLHTHTIASFLTLGCALIRNTNSPHLHGCAKPQHAQRLPEPVVLLRAIVHPQGGALATRRAQRKHDDDDSLNYL